MNSERYLKFLIISRLACNFCVNYGSITWEHIDIYYQLIKITFSTFPKKIAKLRVGVSGPLESKINMNQGNYNYFLLQILQGRISRNYTI